MDAARIPVWFRYPLVCMEMGFRLREIWLSTA
jgi:hypothetical protein